MKRPSITLACILKNEAKNLPRFLESVKGCFDEIHLTDTGSTDGSLNIIKEWMDDGNTPIHLHHFDWVDDFSAARNYSFSHVKTDYVMWMDLDDVLSDREGFLVWRDHAMYLADYWLNTYHYSITKEGKPVCSFARERVFKTSLNPTWRYFVHEGIIPAKDTAVCYAQTWAVNHLRDEEDLNADRSRNLTLFEKNPDRDARMGYYYGKELFENKKPLEAFPELVKAAANKELPDHDRVMALQYGCLAAIELNQFDRCITLAHQGLQLTPLRAEFHIILAEAYLRLNKGKEAMPYYAAAAHCEFKGSDGVQGAIFSSQDSYGRIPLTQLAKIFANQEKFDLAEEYSKKALSFGANPEIEGMLKEVAKFKEKLTPNKDRKKTSDIIITCPATGMYEWDWGVYQTKGIGGSETAAVEMARWLAELTGRKVLIFAPRQSPACYGNVHYRPALEVFDYLKNNSPSLHIAWRHCMKLSDDPFYVWSHDLAFQGVENLPEHAKVLALSQFHKNFLRGLYGVKEEKILVTDNGIDPERFNGLSIEKDPNKVVFSSSPDRGLEKAISVMDEVVKEMPAARLHVYYGFDNMLKMGLTEKVRSIQSLIEARPYVVCHGNLPQKELTKELASASVWLYPTSFLETFCITALEMKACKVWPVVRNWGAVPETLEFAGTIIDSEDPKDYAPEVLRALFHEKWRKIDFTPSNYSWQSVAESWVSLFGLGEKCLRLSNSQ